MIKPLIRRTVRGVALRILERPALAASAKKLVSLAPALDRRLRRILAGTSAPAQPGLNPPSQALNSPSQALNPPLQEAGPVPPEVARVLVDLRLAIAGHKS